MYGYFCNYLHICLFAQEQKKQRQKKRPVIDIITWRTRHRFCHIRKLMRIYISWCTVFRQSILIDFDDHASYVRFILYEKTLRMSSDFSNIRKRCNLIWTFHFFPKNWQLLMSSQHSFSVVQYRRGERNSFVAYPYPPTARRHVVDVSKIEIIIHTRRAHS